MNNVDRRANRAVFATINKFLIKKQNAVKVENFEIYTNDCNSEKFLIVLLILRNRLFIIRIFSKQSILSMNYEKRKKDDTVAIIENTNFYAFAVVLDLLISQMFKIFSLSASFFFYINQTKL